MAQCVSCGSRRVQMYQTRSGKRITACQYCASKCVPPMVMIEEAK